MAMSFIKMDSPADLLGKIKKTSFVSSFMSCFSFSDVEHQKEVPKIQTKHKTRILSQCKVQSQFF